MAESAALDLGRPVGETSAEVVPKRLVDRRLIRERPGNIGRESDHSQTLLIPGCLFAPDQASQRAEIVLRLQVIG